jgi:type III restriction enzyme
LERSLFDFVPQEDFNDMERSVALYLDEQEKLLWWYRNLSRQDYSIQGWKKNKVYPDFIFSDVSPKSRADYSKVFVVETKGLHLKNEDTTYKQDVFTFCNNLGQHKEWKELFAEFQHNRFEFKVIFEDEWKARINDIFG